MKKICITLCITTAFGACKSQRDRNHEKNLAALREAEIKRSDLLQVFHKKEDSTFGKEGIKRLNDSLFMSRYYRASIELDEQTEVVKNCKERVMLEK